MCRCSCLSKTWHFVAGEQVRHQGRARCPGPHFQVPTMGPGRLAKIGLSINTLRRVRQSIEMPHMHAQNVVSVNWIEYSCMSLAALSWPHCYTAKAEICRRSCSLRSIGPLSIALQILCFHAYPAVLCRYFSSWGKAVQDFYVAVLAWLQHQFANLTHRMSGSGTSS